MRPENVPALGYIQMDVKHVTPELSGLPYTFYEYAATDILSRYKMALLQPILDESGSIILLRYAVQSCPFPVKYIQTDNGLESSDVLMRSVMNSVLSITTSIRTRPEKMRPLSVVSALTRMSSIYVLRTNLKILMNSTNGFNITWFATIPGAPTWVLT